MVCLRADSIVRQAKLRLLEGPGLAPVDQVRTRLTACILQRTGDNECCSLGQHQPEDAAVELPQPVLEPVLAHQLPLSRRNVDRLAVREQPVQDDRVDDDDQHGEAAGDREGERDGHSFVDGIRVVQRVVLQGKRLVEGLDPVEDEEAYDERAASEEEAKKQEGVSQSRSGKLSHAFAPS